LRFSEIEKKEASMSIYNMASKLKSTATSSFTSTVVALGGIILAVAGPFFLFTTGGREANKLPWYIWLIMSLLLLVVIGAGFLAFNRKSHDAEDISISPDRKS
jgi:drug/metabolite transporter (DMT)-like permease